MSPDSEFKSPAPTPKKPWKQLFLRILASIRPWVEMEPDPDNPGKFRPKTVGIKGGISFLSPPNAAPPASAPSATSTESHTGKTASSPLSPQE